MKAYLYFLATCAAIAVLAPAATAIGLVSNGAGFIGMVSGLGIGAFMLGIGPNGTSEKN